MKKLLCLRIVSWVGNAASLALLSSTLAGTFDADFNNNQLPAGAQVYGDSGDGNAGVIEEGVLKLTKAVGSLQAGFIIDDLDNGSEISGFTASFKLLIGGGNQADGCSFSFAPDLPDSGFSEEGAGTGFSLCFDTYNNGNDEAPAIDLKNAGNVVATTKGTIGLMRQNQFVEVNVQVKSDGTLSLVVDRQVIYTNFYGAFTPASGRFGFGARTGGSADNHWIDDIHIVTSTAPVTQPARPLVITNAPTGANVSAEPVFHLEVKDFQTQVKADSIQLFLNGTPVSPSVAKVGDTTTIDFDPPGLLASESENKYTLVYTDTGSPAMSVTNEYTFKIVKYSNVVLPAPLFLETFDNAVEGGLPAGWTQTNATVSIDAGEDLGNPNSDSYLGWTVVDRTRLDGNPFNARRLNVAVGYLNNAPITNLVYGQCVYAESDNRSGSQLQTLFSPDYDLTGKTDVHLSYHSIYEQNQDSMGAVEYSIDQGKTWLPILYMIDEVDILKDAAGNIDALKTLTNTVACCGDQPYLVDPATGENTYGGYFGAYLGVESNQWSTLGLYLSGRINDDPTESKRVELFRLPQADNQAKVRFRFVQVGTGSWYFGMDNFGLYSIPSAQAPALQITRNGDSVTISWPASVSGYTLFSTSTLGGSWTAVPGVANNSINIQIGPGTQFYQLRK